MPPKLAQGATITWGGAPMVAATNIDLGGTSSTVDVTSHDSPNRTREYLSALIEPGEAPMTVFWDPSDHAVIATGFSNGSSDTDLLVVTDSDGEIIGGVQAWVKTLTVHVPADGSAQTADVVFQTTGTIDWGVSS